ncbi:hypothetical protein IFM89_016721 [Coptis chinensis]|uniref:3'-5' exonuclease domain-containing protein n=1 Tax=Coptis chinensis TaxID=261450 RepID=A0A835IS09_9MAGN|nr:hypothetical protein IFM89_016721 [Coptis chinensis]
MALVQRTNTANIVHTPNHVILFQGSKIESTVTNSSAVIEDWLSQIYSCFHNGTRIIVGLDCKLKSSYFPKSEVLQLCVDRKCLVIQLCHLDIIPQTLLDFVRDPNILFVGVGVSNWVGKLNEYNKLDCSSAIEAYKLANHSYSSSLLKSVGMTRV